MIPSFFVSLALAAAASASCIHGTSFMKRQEGAVKVGNFGYSGLQGPTNWAGLDPENVACRTSKVQSPIVLDNSISRETEAPKVSIATVEEAEFENRGTTLETVVTGTTTFAGAEFELKQFHLHTPSEHRINDEYFPLEMHMVHEGANGKIAVIAVPFQLTEDGTTTELLTSVIENIDRVTTPGTATKTGRLDFTELINAIQTRPLFQYEGSLTTPPCKEGLTFLVVEEPLALDVKTFNKLKSVIKFNARYTQNTLGQDNLLDVSTQLAIREDPALLGGPGGGIGVQLERNITNEIGGQACPEPVVCPIAIPEKSSCPICPIESDRGEGERESTFNIDRCPPPARVETSKCDEAGMKAMLVDLLREGSPDGRAMEFETVTTTQFKLPQREPPSSGKTTFLAPPSHIISGGTPKVITGGPAKHIVNPAPLPVQLPGRPLAVKQGHKRANKRSSPAGKRRFDFRD